MKLIRSAAILLSATLLGSMSAKAFVPLAPSSIANSSLFGTVTNGNGSLTNTSFFVLVADNSGSNYARFSSASAASVGTYTYSNSGEFGSLLLNDNSFGLVTNLFDFANGDNGTFGATNAASQFEYGTFALASSPTPVAISGLTYNFTVLNGADFPTSSSFSVVLDLTGTNYSYHGNSSDGGSYVYNVLNQSTARVVTTSTNGDGTTVYLGYTADGAGVFALTSTEGGFETGTFSVTTNSTAPFFKGENSLGAGVFFLEFTNSTVFGYYNMIYFPYVYHYDMGWFYFIDADDTAPGAAFLYDFSSGHFWYTGSSLFPYMYDFTLNAWLYYYPSATDPQSYTTNPRAFYNFSTTNTIHF